MEVSAIKGLVVKAGKGEERGAPQETGHSAMRIFTICFALDTSTVFGRHLVVGILGRDIAV